MGISHKRQTKPKIREQHESRREQEKPVGLMQEVVRSELASGNIFVGSFRQAFRLYKLWPKHQVTSQAVRSIQLKIRRKKAHETKKDDKWH